MKEAALLILILFNMRLFGFSQNDFYAIKDNGELIIGNNSNCTAQYLGMYQSFLDIAITPNGNLYGIADTLYAINLVDESYYPIGLTQINGIPIGSLGLVALNDQYLIGDYGDSLCKISVSSGEAENIGFIGHSCNGDFAFLNGKLFMVSIYNHLIQIELDIISNQIISVIDIGQIDTEFSSILSLFTAYKPCQNVKTLFAVEYDKLYEISPIDATASFVCYLSNTTDIYGTTSNYDFDFVDDPVETETPNIFTPNGDNVNDYFGLSDTTYMKNNFELLIFNRWGNIMFKSKNPQFKWDGMDLNGNIAHEGVYFYTVSYVNTCNQNKYFSGFITLAK